MLITPPESRTRLDNSNSLFAKDDRKHAGTPMAGFCISKPVAIQTKVTATAIQPDGRQINQDNNSFAPNNEAAEYSALDSRVEFQMPFRKRQTSLRPEIVKGQKSSCERSKGKPNVSPLTPVTIHSIAPEAKAPSTEIKINEAEAINDVKRLPTVRELAQKRIAEARQLSSRLQNSSDKNDFGEPLEKSRSTESRAVADGMQKPSSAVLSNIQLANSSKTQSKLTALEQATKQMEEQRHGVIRRMKGENPCRQKDEGVVTMLHKGNFPLSRHSSNDSDATKIHANGKNNCPEAAPSKSTQDSATPEQKPAAKRENNPEPYVDGLEGLLQSSRDRYNHENPMSVLQRREPKAKKEQKHPRVLGSLPPEDVDGIIMDKELLRKQARDAKKRQRSKRGLFGSFRKN